MTMRSLKYLSLLSILASTSVLAHKDDGEVGGKTPSAKLIQPADGVTSEATERRHIFSDASPQDQLQIEKWQKNPKAFQEAVSKIRNATPHDLQLILMATLIVTPQGEVTFMPELLNYIRYYSNTSLKKIWEAASGNQDLQNVVLEIDWKSGSKMWWYTKSVIAPIEPYQTRLEIETRSLLDVDDFELVIKYLQTSTQLRQIRIVRGVITREQFQKLAEVLKQFHQIRELAIIGAGIEDTDIDLIIKIIQANPSLKSLVLQDNKITTFGANQLIKASSNGTFQKLLFLQGNNIRSTPTDGCAGREYDFLKYYNGNVLVMFVIPPTS